MIKKLWKLFYSMVYLSTFTFGGGYVIVTLMQKKFVDEYHWINKNEMLDLVAIAQSAPGAIAATLGCILPSCILVTIIAYFYLKYRHMRFLQNILNYLRPAVVALIATAGVTIMISALFGSEATIILKNFRIHQLIIFLFCVFMLWYKKSNPIFVMILSGILNVIYQTII